MLRLQTFLVFLIDTLLESPSVDDGTGGQNQSQAESDRCDHQQAASELFRYFHDSSFSFLQLVVINRANFFRNGQNPRVLGEHGTTGYWSALFLLPFPA